MNAKIVKRSIIAGVFTFSAFFAAGSVSAAPKKFAGELAYQHVQYLTEEIGPRIAGSENETKAREYIIDELEKLDLKVEEQEFSYTRGDKITESANVIAVKDNKHTDKQIIVGAHYDSVSKGKGADDNASSVGVILEKRQRHWKSAISPMILNMSFLVQKRQGYEDRTIMPTICLQKKSITPSG